MIGATNQASKERIIARIRCEPIDGDADVGEVYEMLFCCANEKMVSLMKKDGDLPEK